MHPDFDISLIILIHWILYKLIGASLHQRNEFLCSICVRLLYPPNIPFICINNHIAIRDSLLHTLSKYPEGLKKYHCVWRPRMLCARINPQIIIKKNEKNTIHTVSPQSACLLQLGGL